MKLVLSSTGGIEDANKKQYVLLITGTMNPPHRGHVLIGLRAAAALRAEGHSVTAVCFVPVHDNYLCNKARVSGRNTLFLNMAQRCAMLELLVRAEGEDAALCHVIDYEGEHGSELLEESPGYWEPKLPNYLLTVPTASLIRHFARNSPHMMISGSSRLGLVFGVDNLPGMVSWNRPSELLADCDLVLLARATPAVVFRSDPAELLGSIKRIVVAATVRAPADPSPARSSAAHMPLQVPVRHSEATLFGDIAGDYANMDCRVASSQTVLYLLPPLAGEDEHLSSTLLRKAVSDHVAALADAGGVDSAAAGIDVEPGEALQRIGQHGYVGDAAVSVLLASAAASERALAIAVREGEARGEQHVVHVSEQT